MLKLPAQWQAMVTGCFLPRLALQGRSRRERIDIVRHLIAASFDLGFRAKWSRSGPHLNIAEGPRLTWRIGEYRYIYLPRLDDGVMEELDTAVHPVATTVFLLNGRRVLMFRDTLRFRTRKYYDAFSLADHLSLRLHFSAGDAKWTGRRALWELLDCYNRRAAAAGDLEKIGVPLSDRIG